MKSLCDFFRVKKPSGKIYWYNVPDTYDRLEFYLGMSRLSNTSIFYYGKNIIRSIQEEAINAKNIIIDINSNLDSELYSILNMLSSGCIIVDGKLTEMPLDLNIIVFADCLPENKKILRCNINNGITEKL